MNIQNTTFSSYREITTIGKHENIWLVYEEHSGKVYIKKCLEVFNRRIYEWLATVDNPHIPRVVLCEEHQGRLYVIEEYISGETLEERLERTRCLQEEEVVPLMLQLVQALSYLHGQKPPVIHRDVKLSNIMVSNDGIVKLIDYNAARYYGAGTARDTELIGTAGYAAPEQFGFAQTDARTDIYAFGVVMNYLLTGKNVRLYLYPGKLGKVICKCTHIDPEKRYQSIRKLDAAIRRNASEVSGRERMRLSSGAVKSGRDSRLSNESERMTWQDLWPIPGFRSGRVWKMVLAILGYLMIYSVVLGLEIESCPGGIWIGIERIFIGSSMLFAVALVTDYGRISRFIPLIGHKRFLLRLLGCGIFSFLGLSAMLTGLVLLEYIFVG